MSHDRYCKYKKAKQVGKVTSVIMHYYCNLKGTSHFLKLF